MKTFPTAIACAVLSGLATLAVADEAWKAPEVSRAEVRALAAAGATTTVVLDVRTPEEFAAGHVPGAINIPHDQVKDRLAELGASKDRPIVVYCRSGKRAAKALAILHDAGYRRLSHMTGDMLGWKEDEEKGEQREADSAKPET
ncbi:MAG: Thiosulfate sulfurtransferase GlpE [Steroidobacteraceae bacterium]|nr:Thiosulfate sulfurtransferase GlpE [Steroidobacteraceae bacterium]